MFSEEHLYSIALRKCNLIGDINFYKLVNAVGSAKEVWSFSKKELSKILGIGNKTLQDIGSSEILKFAENELKFCEKNAIQITLRHLHDNTSLLNECEDAPAILYQKGKINPQRKSVSIVGTRNSTTYGKKFLEDFFDELQANTATTISGLALGTDTKVHEFSIAHQVPTIAVLAHGFHTLYPSQNRKLAEQILEKGGALITEFNSTQKPDRENFIQRNRIVAGLSEATIVVETAFGGGSVSTATFANQYNREVFALPGKITDKYSQGCNHLIFQNKAKTISTIKELITELGISGVQEKTGELFPRSELTKQLTDSQSNIYSIICKSPSVSLDEISEKSNIPTQNLLHVLLELELKGLVKSLSGRQYLPL